jgi:hypothetical protein
MARTATEGRSGFPRAIAILAIAFSVIMLAGLARLGDKSLFVALIDPKQWHSLGHRLQNDKDWIELRDQTIRLTENFYQKQHAATPSGTKIWVVAVGRRRSTNIGRADRAMKLMRARISNCGNIHAVVANTPDASLSVSVFERRRDVPPNIRALLQNVRPGLATVPIHQNGRTIVFVECPV